jgi:hypothetical protein
MARDGRQRLALLVLVGARAHRRVRQLMDIGDVEASAVLALAAGGPLTRADLQSHLDLSVGGARALIRALDDRALVVCEPDPADPAGVQLRLSVGADAELGAVLHPLIEDLDTIAAWLTDGRARPTTTARPAS